MTDVVKQLNQITEDQTKAAAHLARIHLSDEEVAIYTKNLNDLNDLFNQLQEIDTTQIRLLNKPGIGYEQLRQDAPELPGLTSFSEDPEDIKRTIPSFNAKTMLIDVPMVLDTE